MTRRAAHGRARELGRLVVSECCPADELPSATPPGTVRPQRSPDGRFAGGNTVARSSRVRSGPQGALAQLDAQSDAAWQAARRWARQACSRRITELGRLHGGELSSEVCALVVDSWELRGDARYIAARARAEGSADLARAAATLLASARQAQRDAWELAAREAAARGDDEGADLRRRQAEFQRGLAARQAASPSPTEVLSGGRLGPSNEVPR
ncbi:MAG: hypothetical protein JW751_28495 [Polyangiaceae bacterium]|nr:hypothetical protein [Polyangiaceae bacterium]